jgi:hypothetical protein
MTELLSKTHHRIMRVRRRHRANSLCLGPLALAADPGNRSDDVGVQVATVCDVRRRIVQCVHQLTRGIGQPPIVCIHGGHQPVLELVGGCGVSSRRRFSEVGDDVSDQIVPTDQELAATAHGRGVRRLRVPGVRRPRARASVLRRGAAATCEDDNSRGCRYDPIHERMVAQQPPTPAGYRGDSRVRRDHRTGTVDP